MALIKLLDGAMGSELIQRGEKLPPHIWSAALNLTNPELVYQIHCDYVNAGAQFLTANTFRTTPRAYEKTGLSIKDAEEKAFFSLQSALNLAFRAAGENVKVLGSIAPLEDCYKPQLFPEHDIAVKEYTQIGKWLLNEGVDIILIETMTNIAEAKACLESISNLNIPILSDLNEH